jgi:hypothetical protein
LKIKLSSERSPKTKRSDEERQLNQKPRRKRFGSQLNVPRSRLHRPENGNSRDNWKRSMMMMTRRMMMKVLIRLRLKPQHQHREVRN